MSVQLSFSIVQFFKPLHSSAHRGDRERDKGDGREREIKEESSIQPFCSGVSSPQLTSWFKLI